MRKSVIIGGECKMLNARGNTANGVYFRAARRDLSFFELDLVVADR